MLSKSYERSDSDRLYGHILTNDAHTATPTIVSSARPISAAMARKQASRNRCVPGA
ncbi:Uncharacterised protein [Bordetella pertussis]|nr:Uncharacterised protein [Bordetella pertussis]